MQPGALPRDGDNNGASADAPNSDGFGDDGDEGGTAGSGDSGDAGATCKGMTNGSS